MSFLTSHLVTLRLLLDGHTDTGGFVHNEHGKERSFIIYDSE